MHFTHKAVKNKESLKKKIYKVKKKNRLLVFVH